MLDRIQQDQINVPVYHGSVSAGPPAPATGRLRRLQLSSWSVDPTRDPTRNPPRPWSLRHESYEEQFDFTTVFYDVFWSPAGDEIICLGPPLFNLEQDLGLTIVAWPSMARCAYRTCFSGVG